MNKFVLAGIVGGSIFVVEEIRAALLIQEMQKRFNDQSIRLASLTERLELLE